jgi:hypothetical protein
MSNQRALNFETRPLSRRDDPASSMKAAERVARRGQLRSQKDRILAAIEAHPGSPAWILAEYVGMQAYDVRKRTADLRREGRAYSVGGTKGRVFRWFPGRDPREGE